LIRLPLLQAQRDLLDIPRGMDRFRAYLGRMLDEHGEVAFPIQGFNPMSREHVQVVLDELLAAGAEDTLAGLLQEFDASMSGGPQPWKVGLVVADDVHGGWTNRAFIELERLTDPRKVAWRTFLPLRWWASERPDAGTIAPKLRRQLFEALSVLREAPPVTLRDILNLRWRSLAYVQGKKPERTPAGKAALAKLAPYLDTSDTGTLLACLFGDDAAVSLGHAPRGIEAGDSELSLAWIASES
jgi:hypothetical protein